MTDTLDDARTEAFAEWRERNAPAVKAITGLALSAAQRGATRISMKSLFEAVRAQGTFGLTDAEPWRLTNNRTADMARWLMERYPVNLGGKFEIRRRRP